jgi:hypothetical protein
MSPKSRRRSSANHPKLGLPQQTVSCLDISAVEHRSASNKGSKNGPRRMHAISLSVCDAGWPLTSPLRWVPLEHGASEKHASRSFQTQRPHFSSRGCASFVLIIHVIVAAPDARWPLQQEGAPAP